MPKNFPESHVETPDKNARRRRNSHVRFWKMGEATAMTEMRAHCYHSKWPEAKVLLADLPLITSPPSQNQPGQRQIKSLPAQ
jgi:hypothetical protein